MKETSEEAQTAKICRAYCKSEKIKAKVKVHDFDSILIRIEDTKDDRINMHLAKKIKKDLSDHVFGSISKESKEYKINNINHSLPQVRFIHVEVQQPLEKNNQKENIKTNTDSKENISR